MKGRAAEGEGLLALSQPAIRTALEGLDLSEIEDILGINRQEELGRFIDPRASCTLDEEIRYASEKLSEVVRYVADDEGEIKHAMQSVRRNVETVRTDRKRAGTSCRRFRRLPARSSITSGRFVGLKARTRELELMDVIIPNPTRRMFISFGV